MQESFAERDDGVNRVRTLIVDNKEGARRLLRLLLASVPGIEVIAEATNAHEARSRISELKPDLVLLDVAIPEFTGIELIRGLDVLPGVIFVTAHPEFAVPAFEVGAIDYLVKPVRQQRFVASMLRAKRRIAECRIAHFALRIAGAAGAIDGGSRSVGAHSLPRHPNQIKIRVRRRMFWLDVADIVWIQGASQYSRVHAKSGEFLLARSLSSLECELDPKRFFRIHRSAIVNANYVQEIRTSGDGRYNVYLHGGPALPLGRSRREILGRLFEGVGQSALASP
jgi:two-component system LytT family response regulator